jgi:hypothetical protein
MNNIHKHTDKNGNVLILKRINKDRTAYGGFKYPAVGCEVKSLSWNPTPTCGDGLHGWPWSFGLGDGTGFNIVSDIWLILAAKPEDVVGNVDGGTKCKCRVATVFFEGSFRECFDKLADGLNAYITTTRPPLALKSGLTLAFSEDAYVGGYVSSSCSVVSCGDATTLTSLGSGGKLAISGSVSRITSSGHGARLCSIGADCLLVTMGDYSRSASCGDYDHLISTGDSCKLATASNYGVLVATGKHSVVLSSGLSSTACVGEKGCFALTYYDTDEQRYNILVGRVGENGILANTYYQCKKIDGVYKLSPVGP